MLIKYKLSVMLVIIISTIAGQVFAKERRGDDLIASFNVTASRSPTYGVWAMISTNKFPTLTKRTGKAADDPDCAGIFIWGCYFNSSTNGLLPPISNQIWVKIHKSWPTFLNAADVNGDGRDEIVASYSDGIFLIYNAHTNSPTWRKVLSVGQEVEVADFNGNRKADLIIFSTKPGLQIRMDNVRWIQLTNESISAFWSFNLDAKFRDDLVALIKNKPGIHIKRKNQKWQKIHTRSPLNIWRADLDGDGKDNIIANFGAKLGTYMRQANGRWLKIWSGSPTHVEAADVNGNGKDDLVFYLNNNQVYIRYDNGKWRLLRKGITRILAAGDIDGNGKDDIVFSQGIGYVTSTIAWMNNSEWALVADGEAVGNLNGRPGPGSCGGGLGEAAICGWLPDSGFVRNTYTFANLDGR